MPKPRRLPYAAMQLVDAAIMQNVDALRALRGLMRRDGGEAALSLFCAQAVDHIHKANEFLRQIRDLRPTPPPTHPPSTSSGRGE